MSVLECLSGRPWAVLPGDCVASLAALPAESIDACVTDTPYGLSTILDPPRLDRETLWRALTSGAKESPIKTLMRSWLDTGENPKVNGRGFMGKEWDALVPSPNTWRAIWRVLKPGAYCFAFGGTRTYALIEMALRFADFEIDDGICTWLYGCLSEDTEIMVDGEWQHWTAAVAGATVMAYSLADDTLRPEVVQDLVVYDYDDVAFHVRGDRTDHIVSRNHRCLADLGGGWDFTLAERLPTQALVPVVENHDELRNVWRNSDAVRMPREEGQGGILLEGVQWQEARRGIGQACAQGSGGMDRQVAGFLPREDDGRAQPIVAWRSDAARAEGELCGSALRAMPAGIPVDGAGGRLHHGASSRDGAETRSHADADGGRASHQSRPAGQPNREPDAVRHEPGSQALRGARFASADLATVTPIHYRGKMWCVRVPSGAFVARRNGKVFITGNSGFPKRVRLDLKIDQHLGKAGERQVLGKHPRPGGTQPRTGMGDGWQDAPTITGPATPEAARFVGWDRALRPGWEPIIVAVKPLRGTVAENALAYGTGGLHVDACRIPRGDIPDSTRPAGSRPMFAGMDHHEREPWQAHAGGGYPANVVISEEVAEELDRQSGVRRAGKPRDDRGTGGIWSHGDGIPCGPQYGDEGGASRFFYVAKASSSERDAGLDDLPPLTAGERCDRKDGSASINAYSGTRGEGGRNPHPTVKPIALMRWLCRLASPPGANDPDESKRPVILDPFAGSGSTGVAAMREGVRFIGCELDPKMADVMRRRLQHAYAIPPDDAEAPERRVDAPGQRTLF